MGLVIAASVIAFITTEMDDLLVVFILLSKAFSARHIVAVALGKYISLALLVFVCRFFSDLLSIFPQGSLGLLGIIPIVLGVLYAVNGFSGEDLHQSRVRKSSWFLSVVLETFVITLANSSDNVAVYVSFFTSLMQDEFILACVVFAVLQAAWILIAVSVMSAQSIRDYIRESRRVLVPLLFIVLGIYIFLSGRTVAWLFGRQTAEEAGVLAL